jgi:hypothetical protein
MKKLVVGIFALLPLLFIGCSEDEPVDIRLAAVGEYSGTVKYYYLDGSNLIDLNIDENIEFVVSIGSQAKTISINVEGDEFLGTKVEEASNGFSFDINSVVLNGANFSGYQGITQGSAKYDGRYEKNSQRLTFYLNNSIDGETYVYRIQGDL